MRKMVYTNKIDNYIISHENHMLALYKEKIKKYEPLFEEKGYSLKVGFMWDLFPGNSVTFQREKFKDGYQCYVYCVVQNDNNDVHIASVDGEADYYSLSTTWMISSIFRKFCRLSVTLCVSIDDVDTDLMEILSELKHTK